jgi:hypothetical protein
MASLLGKGRAWMGLDVAKAFWASTTEAVDRAVRGAGDGNGDAGGKERAPMGKAALLKSNLVEGAGLARIPISRVFATWGLKTDEDVRVAILRKRRERACGAALFAVCLVLWIRELLLFDQSAFRQGLHGFGALTFMTVGAALWTSAHWRIQVLERRRFVPFLKWIANGFSMGQPDRRGPGTRGMAAKVETP